MLDFLNSVGLQTLIELLVGGLALLVYKWQKKDRVKSVATAVLLEIQQAEKSVAILKKNMRRGYLNVDFKILQNDTWNKYKYLFAKVLDVDEMTAISDFYANAKILDESIEYEKKCFNEDVEQIRINRQRVFTDFMRETVEFISKGDTDGGKAISELQNKMNLFDNIYMNQPLQYSRYNPQKILDDAKQSLDNFSNLSTTTVGQKLKKLSKRRLK